MYQYNVRCKWQWPGYNWGERVYKGKSFVVWIIVGSACIKAELVNNFKDIRNPQVRKTLKVSNQW